MISIFWMKQLQLSNENILIMTTTTHNITQLQVKFKDTAINIVNYLAKEAVWDDDRCNWIGHAVEAVHGQYQMVQKI